MSDRTFRLIFDGKKGGLVKGSSPSSAAKKACKKLSAETGKTSFKFELQETTKDSKKKVYGPYKIKVKMTGGTHEKIKPSWDTQFGEYFPQKPVISNTSLERKLQDLYELKKKFSIEFGPNNTQFNNQIAKLEKQIRERNLNVTRSVANLEGQQISALSNRVLSKQNKKSTFDTANNSLPTVSNMQRYKKNGNAEQRSIKKRETQDRNAARIAKFPPFNNN